MIDSQYQQYQVRYSPNVISDIQQQYERDGFCIFRNLFHHTHMERARKVINQIVKVLIRHYDSLEDEFQGFDREEHNIVRMPRIGRGKHNIHFDPEFSDQHQVLFQLVAEAGVLDILSSVSGGVCSLRESGMSLTRPQIDNFGTVVAGEGMEWHSDGAKGEYTMLLGLEDVSPDMGALRIVPKSHLEYIDGIGHEEVKSVSLFSRLFFWSDDLDIGLLRRCYLRRRRNLSRGKWTIVIEQENPSSLTPGPYTA